MRLATVVSDKPSVLSSDGPRGRRGRQLDLFNKLGASRDHKKLLQAVEKVPDIALIKGQAHSIAVQTSDGQNGSCSISTALLRLRTGGFVTPAAMVTLQHSDMGTKPCAVSRQAVDSKVSMLTFIARQDCKASSLRVYHVAKTWRVPDYRLRARARIAMTSRRKAIALTSRVLVRYPMIVCGRFLVEDHCLMRRYLMAECLGVPCLMSSYCKVCYLGEAHYWSTCRLVLTWRNHMYLINGKGRNQRICASAFHCH